MSTILMLARSWPLWLGAGTIPRVPFVAGFDGPPAPHAAFGVWLAVLAAATVLGSVAPGGHPWVRRLVVPTLDLLSLGLAVALVVADQHRFQPWIYQYALATLALATLVSRQAVGVARLILVVIYLASGLSKLDVTFTRELGGLFLATALRPFGLDPAGWPELGRTAAVLVMPVGEVLVAVGLCVRATRRAALAGAIGLHATLIGLLGPWGLGHSTIVLIWNAAMIAEVLILFGPRRIVAEAPAANPPYRRLVEIPVKAVVLIAAVMPLFERRGYWDAWPSFALYASHVERADVFLGAWEEARFPDTVREHLGPVNPSGYRRLNLNGWSLAERGTPVYPQARAQLGLAEALAAAPGRPRDVYVEILGRADRLSGARSKESLLGLTSIRHRAGRFWPNAHPDGPPVPDPTAARRMQIGSAR